jgi:hypothetical protein
MARGMFAEELHELFEEKRFERHKVVHEGIDQALTADGESPKERRALRLRKVGRDHTEVEPFEGDGPLLAIATSEIANLFSYFVKSSRMRGCAATPRRIRESAVSGCSREKKSQNCHPRK